MRDASPTECGVRLRRNVGKSDQPPESASRAGNGVGGPGACG